MFTFILVFYILTNWILYLKYYFSGARYDQYWGNLALKQEINYLSKTALGISNLKL